VRSISQSAISVEGLSPWLKLGSLVDIAVSSGTDLAEVIRLERDVVICKLFNANAPVSLGLAAYPSRDLRVMPCDAWQGRIVDALGRPVDGRGVLPNGSRPVPLHNVPPPAMQRRLVDRAVKTGVRVIDTFTPVCFGQRLGVFAGSGVGKSSLLSMLANADAFDVIVIGGGHASPRPHWRRPGPARARCC
jgi:Flagellar biosynthesis/type III secretory pathway ATPase